MASLMDLKTYNNATPVDNKKAKLNSQQGESFSVFSLNMNLGLRQEMFSKSYIFPL